MGALTLLSLIVFLFSVFFFKTIRQKILDFLNPLTEPLGVQLMAAVAAVWSRKKGKRHSKTKVKPEMEAAHGQPPVIRGDPRGRQGRPRRGGPRVKLETSSSSCACCGEVGGGSGAHPTSVFFSFYLMMSILNFSF